MVAKINVGTSLYGALAYNGLKVNEGEGKLLAVNKVFDDGSGRVDIARAVEDFRRYMPENVRTRNKVIHISLNPHPDDRLTDMEMEQLAREYLEKLGYGDQPFLIFKHEDISRHHLHIVSVNVDERGRRLNKDFIHRRSKRITTELERKYGLHPADRRQHRHDNPLRKVDVSQGGAMEQLAGQIASAKIPLSRMISPQLYWVMSDSEFTLDINNPDEPKILCVGNNPDRQNIYGAALGLYNSRIVKLINKKGKLKSAVIIDELPTIYFKGLDNLIATARSNKVAVCLGFQDFSQLKRDYGDKEAAVVMNTVGNIFSGQVVGETAKTLSERFGKILQKRQSITINREDKSTSINTQMESLIPASKISTLTQGMFVGAVADNFNERIEQKIFHCEIVVDAGKVKREEQAYKPIPVITDFIDADGNDRMKEMIQENYNRIRAEVRQIVADELQRIQSDPELQHLLQNK